MAVVSPQLLWMNLIERKEMKKLFNIQKVDDSIAGSVVLYAG